MSALTWHDTGDREFEAGVSKVVLYPMGDSGYENGVAWNGVTAINESPAGADKSDLYADNIKYASLRAAETFGGTIEAYTYPDEWAVCDGSAEPVDGVIIGQQPRKAFGLCYRTEIGDEGHPGLDKGYKLHLVYNCTVSPSERAYATINDNPDAITFSWEFDATPVGVTGAKDTACITINSLKVDSTKLTALEATLYGSTTGDATLPTPDQVISALSPTPTPNPNPETGS